MSNRDKSVGILSCICPCIRYRNKRTFKRESAKIDDSYSRLFEAGDCLTDLPEALLPKVKTVSDQVKKSKKADTIQTATKFSCINSLTQTEKNVTSASSVATSNETDEYSSEISMLISSESKTSVLSESKIIKPAKKRAESTSSSQSFDESTKDTSLTSSALSKNSISVTNDSKNKLIANHEKTISSSSSNLTKENSNYLSLSGNSYYTCSPHIHKNTDEDTDISESWSETDFSSKISIVNSIVKKNKLKSEHIFTNKSAHDTSEWSLTSTHSNSDALSSMQEGSTSIFVSVPSSNTNVLKNMPKISLYQYGQSADGKKQTPPSPALIPKVLTSSNTIRALTNQINKLHNLDAFAPGKEVITPTQKQTKKLCGFSYLPPHMLKRKSKMLYNGIQLISRAIEKVVNEPLFDETASDDASVMTVQIKKVEPITMTLYPGSDETDDNEKIEEERSKIIQKTTFPLETFLAGGIAKEDKPLTTKKQVLFKTSKERCKTCYEQSLVVSHKSKAKFLSYEKIITIINEELMLSSKIDSTKVNRQTTKNQKRSKGLVTVKNNWKAKPTIRKSRRLLSNCQKLPISTTNMLTWELDLITKSFEFDSLHLSNHNVFPLLPLEVATPTRDVAEQRTKSLKNRHLPGHTDEDRLSAMSRQFVSFVLKAALKSVFESSDSSLFVEEHDGTESETNNVNDEPTSEVENNQLSNYDVSKYRPPSPLFRNNDSFLKIEDSRNLQISHQSVSFLSIDNDAESKEDDKFTTSLQKPRFFHESFFTKVSSSSFTAQDSKFQHSVKVQLLPPTSVQASSCNSNRSNFSILLTKNKSFPPTFLKGKHKNEQNLRLKLYSNFSHKELNFLCNRNNISKINSFQNRYFGQFQTSKKIQRNYCKTHPPNLFKNEIDNVSKNSLQSNLKKPPSKLNKKREAMKGNQSSTNVEQHYPKEQGEGKINYKKETPKDNQSLKQPKEKSIKNSIFYSSDELDCTNKNKPEQINVVFIKSEHQKSNNVKSFVCCSGREPKHNNNEVKQNFKQSLSNNVKTVTTSTGFSSLNKNKRSEKNPLNPNEIPIQNSLVLNHTNNMDDNSVVKTEKHLFENGTKIDNYKNLNNFNQKITYYNTNAQSPAFKKIDQQRNKDNFKKDNSNKSINESNTKLIVCEEAFRGKIQAVNFSTNLNQYKDYKTLEFQTHNTTLEEEPTVKIENLWTQHEKRNKRNLTTNWQADKISSLLSNPSAFKMMLLKNNDELNLENCESLSCTSEEEFKSFTDSEKTSDLSESVQSFLGDILSCSSLSTDSATSLCEDTAGEKFWSKKNGLDRDYKCFYLSANSSNSTLNNKNDKFNLKENVFLKQAIYKKVQHQNKEALLSTNSSIRSNILNTVKLNDIKLMQKNVEKPNKVFQLNLQQKQNIFENANNNLPFLKQIYPRPNQFETDPRPLIADDKNHSQGKNVSASSAQSRDDLSSSSYFTTCSLFSTSSSDSKTFLRQSTQSESDSQANEDESSTTEDISDLLESLSEQIAYYSILLDE